MAVPKLKYGAGNSGSTAATGSILSTDTSIPLSSATNFQAAPTPGEGMILLDEGTTSEELAYATGLSSSSLTTPLVNRGQEGTAAVDHSGTFSVKAPLTVGMWNDMITSLLNLLVQSTGDLDVTKVIDPSSSQTITGKTMDYSSNTFTGFPGGADGWTGDSGHTWSYLSASTFTISGVDLTGTFTKGMRLRFKQGGAYKFAVVTASAFSTDTTVTIAVNTDFTIANASITDNYYSYQSTALGYPDVFNFSETWTGFSAAPSGGSYKYTVLGNECRIYINRGDGTSNSANTTVTIPVTAATASDAHVQGTGRDNGAYYAGSAPGYVQAGTNVLNCYKTADQSGGWTTSGSKNWFGQFSVIF